MKPPAYPPLMPITIETTVASSARADPDRQRGARADHQLGEHVLADLGGAEPVSERRRRPAAVRLSWFGLLTKNGPMMPSSTKKPTMALPATSRGERNGLAEPASRAGARRRQARRATAATTLVAVTATASSAGR